MPYPLCLNSNTYHGFSLEEAIEGAARAGFRLVELSAVAGYTEHVMPGMDDARVDGIVQVLRHQGVRPIALGGHADLTSLKGRERFRANLGLASRLGVAYVVTGTGETHGDESQIGDAAEFAAHLRDLADDAQQLGLRIAIETHGANYPTGAAVNALVESVASPAVGIAYDTGNTIFYGDVRPYEDLESILPSVVGVHLKDKIGGPQVWNFPAIGDGETDFRRVRDILRQGDTGTTVPLSIEIEFTQNGPGSVAEVHEAVARSVAHLRSIGLDDGTSDT